MGVVRRCSLAFAVLGVALFAAPQVSAQAVINNGKVAIGADRGGNINVPGVFPSCHANNDNGCGVGVLNMLTGNEATYEGCPCEGWGAGIAGGALDGTWGGANASAYGYSNVSGSGAPTIVSYVNDATTATSVVNIDDLMSVTHFFHPSATLDLYQVDVTITNTSGGAIGVGANGIRYRRLMDWDIDPTPFDEFSTIHGNGATNLLHTGNDGFQSSDMFGDLPFNLACAGTALDTDFSHGGPCDHGALFDFGFGALGVGESVTFSIFYGVAVSEAAALADLGIVGADDVYSFGQSTDCSHDPTDPCIQRGETFIFGFKGVGGHLVVTPEPASFVLMGTGLAGIAAFVRRRRRSTQPIA